MYRRVIVLALLLVGLVLVVAPAAIAVHALLDGDADYAWRVFGPVLLIPVGFLLLGLVWSFRHAETQRRSGRRPTTGG